MKVTAKDFAAKYQSKREVYNMLSVDVGYYLPPYGKYLLAFTLILMFSTFRASHDLLPSGRGLRQKEE